MPLTLTDDQMSAIMHAAQPLAVGDRAPFLHDVAVALDGQELGDGLVSRVCRDVQRRYWRPPLETSQPAQLRKIGR